MFRATDEKGKMFENDEKFASELKKHGLDFMLRNVCGLDMKITDHKDLAILINHAYGLLEAWNSNAAHHLRRNNSF